MLLKLDDFKSIPLATCLNLVILTYSTDSCTQ